MKYPTALHAYLGQVEKYLSAVDNIFLGSASFCPPACYRVAKTMHSQNLLSEKVTENFDVNFGHDDNLKKCIISCLGGRGIE